MTAPQTYKYSDTLGTVQDVFNRYAVPRIPLSPESPSRSLNELVAIVMKESFPNALLRAYRKRKYAEKFVCEGVFRLGKLQIYRDIEDKSRSDASEGLGYYIDKNGIHESFEFGGDIYLLSLSTTDVSLGFLTSKMGESVVKVNSTKDLVVDIDGYLKSNGYATFGGVKGCHVQYNKGCVINKELNAMDRATLSVTQKPSDFSAESEYRLFVICNSQNCPKPLGEYLEIDLGKKLDYVEMVK